MYKSTLPETLRRWQKALDSLPLVLGDAALEWADTNFEKQGFQGATFTPWRNKWPKKGKRNKVLINTGRLRASGRVKVLGGRRIQITYGNEIVTYARVHNEGLTVVQRVPAHERRGRKGRKHSVRAHSRTASYPKNQFIGDSPQLRKYLYRVIREELGA